MLISTDLQQRAFNHAVSRTECVEAKYNNEQDAIAELCQRLSVLLDRRKWRLSRTEQAFDEAEETLLMQKLNL